jgi:glycosyltransferase involved in cell wall biosynthesis
MNGRPRVLMVIPNLGTGGAQKVFRQQMHFLSLHCDLVTCVFNREGFLPEDFDRDIKSLDVPGGKNVITKITYFFLRVARLRRLKKMHSIDVCISHLEGADYVNLLSRRRDKMICWIHGSKRFDQNISGWLGRLRKKILIPMTYGRANRIVTVSQGIRSELLADYQFDPSKVVTINNSFDFDAIRRASEIPLDAEFASIFEKPVLITHCRLAREKNLFVMLELFALIRQRLDVHLIVLGDGDLRSKLITQSQELNLKTFNVWNKSNEKKNDQYDVFFLGYQSNPYHFLSRATLYLMTSLNEGFPLALCEAMERGFPPCVVRGDGLWTPCGLNRLLYRTTGNSTSPSSRTNPCA